MEGLHLHAGTWTLMLQGFANLNYLSASGPRGAAQTFSTNMLMAHAARAIGRGDLELRFMGTVEPAMGPRGYPLLLQTGESADGLLPLVDRQHPHDVVMELSALWSVKLPQGAGVFLYVAPVGEPAVGPPAFMHRASGSDIPTAPIGHHTQDASHITYGVITAGLTSEQRLKLEASVFNGREPDQHHWNIEAPRLDSWALRLSADINANITFQGSAAGLNSPERMHPGIDQVRLTTSLTWNRPLAAGDWQTTLVYGSNRTRKTLIPLTVARETFPAPVLAHYVALASLSGIPADSLTLVFPGRVRAATLLESTWRGDALSVFLRLERAGKDEMFPPTDLRHSRIYTTGSIDLGTLYDLKRGPLRFGLGGVASLKLLGRDLHQRYGDTPISWQVFTRIALR
jgi:hypothetical protein